MGGKRLKLAVNAQLVVVPDAPPHALKLANGKNAVLQVRNVGYAQHSGKEVPGEWIDVLVVS